MPLTDDPLQQPPSGRDHVRRFVFEHFAVRGQLVELNDSWRKALSTRRYAIPVRETLGQAMAASALLASTIKFDGKLTMQVTSAGPLRLLVVQCRSDLTLRAMARADERAREAQDFHQLVSDGRLVLNIETGGNQRYQGIVALERPDFAACLEDYFTNSEQLPTRLFLGADRQRAMGLLLQKMPLEEDAPEHMALASEREWDRVQQLALMVPPDEFMRHDDEALLRRLFPNDDVRLFAPSPVRFHCGCSRARIERVLRMMGRQEVDAAIEEEGTLTVSCEFCGRAYLFDAQDAAAVFEDGAGEFGAADRDGGAGAGGNGGGNNTLH
jgi:molecular chaperone Hsp33